MANGELSITNHIASATLSAGAALSSQPVSNLASMDVAEKWESGNNSTYILADAGADMAWDVVALFGVNDWTAAATVRVRVTTAANGDTTGAAGDAYDSGTVSANVTTRYGTAAHVITTTKTGRWLRIDIADTGLTTLKAGRWWAGELLQPATNYDYEFKRGVADKTTRNETDGGQSHARRKATRRTLEVSFRYLLEAEVYSIGELLMFDVGLFGDLLFVLDRASGNLSRDVYLMQLEDFSEMTHANYNRNRVDFKMIERK